MNVFEKLKSIFAKKEKTNDKFSYISLVSMEEKYQAEDYMGAAKDLKILLEKYGRRKEKTIVTKAENSSILFSAISIKI